MRLHVGLKAIGFGFIVGAFTVLLTGANVKQPWQPMVGCGIILLGVMCEPQARKR